VPLPPRVKSAGAKRGAAVAAVAARNVLDEMVTRYNLSFLLFFDMDEMF
jgi:hypothetical protein